MGSYELPLNSKDYLIAWWLFIIIFIFLWYRNHSYDRVIGVFIFVIGIVQLFYYGLKNGANEKQTNQAILISLWLQVLVISLATFVFFQKTNEFFQKISLFTLIIFSMIFIFFFAYVMILNPVFDNGDVLGYWTSLYFLGIFIPMILFFVYYEFKSLGTFFLIIFMLMTIAILLRNYPVNQLVCLFNYYMLGFAFLAFFIGLVPGLQQPRSEETINKYI